MANVGGFEPPTFGSGGGDAPEESRQDRAPRVQLVSSSAGVDQADGPEIASRLREARLRYLLACVSSDPEERAKRDRLGAELAEWAERAEAALAAVSEAEEAG